MVNFTDTLSVPGGDDAGRNSFGSQANLLSLMIDGIAEENEMLAVVHARLAGLMCQALRFSLEHQRLFTESEGSASSRDEWARRAFVSELATALKLSERKVESMLASSEALVADLPETLDALRSGEISYRHAELMVSQANGLDALETRRFESEAIAVAASSTPPQFNRSALALRERMHPETAVERKKAAKADRHIENYGEPDGMGWFSIYAPIEMTESFAHVARNTALSLKAVGDARTLRQIAADAVSDALMKGFAWSGEPADSGEDEPRSASGAVRPSVHVTVPVMTLLGHSEESAELEGYGPIDAETARELSANAPSFTRILTHPETGAVLSVGRDRYAVPADLRKAVEIRDETCGFAGCNRSASSCDIDHRQDWQYGGKTEIDNLNALCRPHHRLKHETRWAVDRTADGYLVWTSPLERHYVVRPYSEPGFTRIESKVEVVEPEGDAPSLFDSLPDDPPF